ncbi:hypothetical protein QCA50_013155 [Cerrena zonata]|uniref:Uncharacterized protein n=1 Tax=Cerrena zonata TaxID=2478898 RepID=A0AAW0FXF1_9APHY
MCAKDLPCCLYGNREVFYTAVRSSLSWRHGTMITSVGSFSPPIWLGLPDEPTLLTLSTPRFSSVGPYAYVSDFEDQGPGPEVFSR